eukprot:Gregarina_sp_Poly_1__1209@NODE_1298_length_4457_cov_159_361048_g878_i0_p2_GENE_NODE_1298_length_4457_cov_159_361048_g878_i0NODE_1298_length_4457_cov_159_361048_g878_i0_p2_ORF_typecomplete_len341_score49_67JAB/PF01398_21/1_6e28MitMem_reg/PF13012_6/6e19_NODE_1298_length_4457_cov_159_361048_g878_i01821204
MPEKQPKEDDPKAEPAILKEKREALEKKRRAKKLAIDDPSDPSARTGYTYFKESEIDLLRNDVFIHPTVLLSITDHYTRAAQGTSRRVVGVLLGETQSDGLHVTNTFGVPFEEDTKDPSVWYVDHSYLEKMFHMFKKINVRERLLGWYSTAASIKSSDLEIHELIRNYCQHPLYLLVNVHSQDTSKLPIQTYYAFEQPSADDKNRSTFVQMTCSIGATEAEDVGVEHLLKDLQTATTSTLSSSIQDKISALKQLAEKLMEISVYLQEVADGKRAPKTHILIQLQRLLNALPAKNDPAELAQAFQLGVNDSLLATFVAFATRLVLTIHELVKNKVKLRQKM